MEVGSIGQRELVLAVSDKALYSLVIVVVFRIGDQSIDAIHLAGDLFAYRNLASYDCISKLPVVFWYCGVREHYLAVLPGLRG